MKKLSVLIIAICMILSATSAFAAINADPEFASASITLTSRKLVVYSANLYDEKERIAVVNADLYIKVGNDWSFVCSLPVPTHVQTDSSSYGASIDYSDYIGTGTYRVTATYDADGYQITRNSNERSF